MFLRLVVVLLMAIVLFVVMMIRYMEFKEKMKMELERVDKQVINNNKIKASDELLKSLDIDEKNLKKELYDVFVKVLEAESKFDYSSLETLCSDELYSNIKKKLELQELKKERNIIDKIDKLEVNIKMLEEDDKNISVSLYIELIVLDYTVDSKGNIIRGRSDELVVNKYNLTFIRGKANSKTKIVCPNCGNLVNVNNRGECDYCHSVIIKKASNFVLSDIKGVSGD